MRARARVALYDIRWWGQVPPRNCWLCAGGIRKVDGFYDQRSTRTYSFYSIEHTCSPQKDTSKMAMEYMYALFLAVVAAAVGAPEAAAAGDGDDLFKTSFWRVC